MAKAAATEEENPPAAAARRSLLLPIVAGVVIAVGASAGISFVMMQHAMPKPAAEAGQEGKSEEAKVEKKSPPVYIPLDPAFVVNLEGDDTRFLQAQVQLMAREAQAADEIKLHEPRIRNALLMIFSQQRAADIATREGKEKLQASVLAEVQKIMTEETGKPTIEAVYFTSFVTQ
ncbi:flagellar basal body-associated FliL family protein [Solimonas soli]|uniref:flagellar basal body-associated FliL family protein n=1 Tax=Solimonas soli TaxID=413479 RepID=UPI000485B8CA|nr:flagellar basal body-associated FliL family protein [Solimonas soli]